MIFRKESHQFLFAIDPSNKLKIIKRIKSDLIFTTKSIVSISYTY